MKTLLTPRPSYLLLMAAFSLGMTAQGALASPLLGSDLASFTVLGASTVTNVPTSTVVGDVGVWSSGGANAITGFLSSPGVAVSDPQVTSGSVHAGTSTGTPNAMDAQSQLTTAINGLNSLGVGTLLGADLVGLTLSPGIYTVPAGTTNLSGALTLDGQGNANAGWVFQMESSLISSPNSAIRLINTGNGAGIYWNVRSSATIDTNTTFLGNILALASITMNTTATNLCGRVLASTGAVTLDQNSLSGTCADTFAGSDNLSGGLELIADTGSGTTVTGFLPYAPVDVGGTVPEPSPLALLGIGVVALWRSRMSRG